MDTITLAILAHVDAGKTTTAEAMLYECGVTRTLGRVDHKDAFLDTDLIERERGITIFSKQAVLEIPQAFSKESGVLACHKKQPLRIDLLDTPGHADFSAETERVLSVPDYALLVISGPDGVQAHTRTLWQLLVKYHIPTFVWVNRMDQCHKSRKEILKGLSADLGEGFTDFDDPKLLESEETAALSEYAIEEYLQNGALSKETVRRMIALRSIFPCFFGSALKLQGVKEMLGGIYDWTEDAQRSENFGAKVFKITHDKQGNRLTWLKITGGSLKVREMLGDEKVSQIRIYNGVSFTQTETAAAGMICAVLGLAASYAGQGFGTEEDSKAPLLEPVLSYSIVPVDGTDPSSAYLKLKTLAEEDPQLRLVWDTKLREIQVQFMGKVQAEVLARLISDRFGIETKIGTGRILYRETIAGPSLGVGHFEPLRHYAEVHVLLEPLPSGSGIVCETAVSTDELDLNWQRLILSNLEGKHHVGVLTGAPLTDVKITLVAGRAHLKHTEGGDFREACTRAVRNALMKAQNVLLEPFYAFRAIVPASLIGRTISDLKTMRAVFESPVDVEGNMLITGRAPASELADYPAVLLSYTKGLGQISLRSCGYYPCHDTQAVIEAAGYEPQRDLENPADSVFCSHGAGVNVKWDHVSDFMHLDSGIRIVGDAEEEPHIEVHQPKLRSGSLDFDEKELEAIMQREFGPIKRPKYTAVVYNRAVGPASGTEVKKNYLIVDGYNMIFAWEDLKKLAEADISAARDRLIGKISDLSTLRGIKAVLVFDGYKVPKGMGSDSEEGGVRVIYTKEGETADAYIERLAREVGKNYNVKVASSDNMIQISALRSGLLRVSARELLGDVRLAEEEISEILYEQRRSNTFSNNPRQDKEG